MTTSYDAIVIGLGSMGSAALYHLARRGQRVLGLEQFDVPNALGSSVGVSRIIRLAYAEHPDYVPLLLRAYELWRELEALARERLLVITGGLDVGRENEETVKGSLRSCQVHNLAHDLLDAGTVKRRFPGYRLAPDMMAVYQPDGGFLMSERCVVAHTVAALDLGAEIHGRERATSWCASEAGVRVTTESGTYEARSLVVTAGPWVGELVAELAPLAIPERQVMLWAQPLRPQYFRTDSFPVFNLQAPEGRFYGLPVFGVPGFKIGKYHHRRQRVRLDALDRDCHAEDETVLREGLRRYFPDADGPTLAMKVCLFTNTSDEHFILDHHPDHPRVAIAAGFSGHGFKFCSVVGEIMADLVLEGTTRHPIDTFRLARLAKAHP
ncbi:MAG TPA: N-methyl-L-tryptophan oxidase [Polyangiaceae bacterium]|jgi:sarcosine oxidase|nr:N-methyl-L-tryptophan oxidase [Polyangiaceae bacterium]